MKIRTGCQYVGYFHCSEHLNWAACGPRLDIAGLKVECAVLILARRRRESFRQQLLSRIKDTTGFHTI